MVDHHHPAVAGQLAREQDALSGDRFDASGALTYPSDFQLRKRACDVVLVGDALARPGPTQLRVGRMRKHAESARALGPARGHGAEGAIAPEDQRIAFPGLPLELSVERHDGLVAGALPGPAPSAALVYGGAWHAPYPVELVVDGVLVDTVRGRCFATFRGSFRHGAPSLDGLALLLDPSGANRVAPQAMRSWRRYEAQIGEPAPVAPVRAVSRTERMTATDAASMRAAMAGVSPATRAALVKPPERSPGPRPPMDTEVDEGAELPSHSTISMAAVTDDGAPLPFTRSKSETAAMPTRTAASYDGSLPFVQPASHAPPPLVAPARVPVAPGDDDVDPHGGTVSLPRSPAAGLAPAPPPSDSGLPFVKAAPKDAESPRRPVMMIGAIGTPLAYPPTPFANRGAGAPLPSSAAVVAPAPTPRPSEPSAAPPPPVIVVPPPVAAAPVAAPAPVAARPPAAVPVPGPVPSPVPGPVKAYDIPTYARQSFAAGTDARGVPRPLGVAPEPAAAPEKRLQGLSLEELAAIRAELWADPEGRRAVLKKYGLSELRWRVVERAWAAELETVLVNPEKVGEAVSRMRNGRAPRVSPAPAH